MDPSFRVVPTGTSLNVLWDERGLDLPVRRVRDVGASEIREILRSRRPAPFVVAVIGMPLRWIRG